MKCELCHEEMTPSGYNNKYLVCPIKNYDVENINDSICPIFYRFIDKIASSRIEYYSHFVFSGDYFKRCFFIQDYNILFKKDKVIVINYSSNVDRSYPLEFFDCNPSNYINVINNYEILK